MRRSARAVRMSEGEATSTPSRSAGESDCKQRRDVGDALAGGAGAQRRRRRLEVARLALEIILDHDEVALGRHRHEGRAPRGRERDAGRPLVARRDVDDAAAGEPFVHDHAFVVHGLEHDARAAAAQERDELGIARLFDGDGRARLDQELDREVQRLLAAGGDQHFVRPRVDAAAREHLAADFLQQLAVVGIRGVGGPVADLGQGEHHPARLAPFRDGEQREVELRADEGIRELLPVRRHRHQFLDLPRATQLALPDRRLDRRRFARGAQLIAADGGVARVADVDAAARPRLEMPVRDQALVGRRDRVPRNLELARERARGRQFLRRRERADRDTLHDPLADLVLQVQRLAPVDRQKKGASPFPFGPSGKRGRPLFSPSFSSRASSSSSDAAGYRLSMACSQTLATDTYQT